MGGSLKTDESVDTNLLNLLDATVRAFDPAQSRERVADSAIVLALERNFRRGDSWLKSRRNLHL